MPFARPIHVRLILGFVQNIYEWKRYVNNNSHDVRINLDANSQTSERSRLKEDVNIILNVYD